MLAEIDILKSKLVKKYQLGLIQETTLNESMRLLENQEALFSDIENDQIVESSANRNTKHGLNKQYAQLHGLSVIRGKHWAKIQRDLNNNLTMQEA